MSEKIGPIPKTAIITLETQKELWQNVNWKILKNFLTTGIVEHEGIKKRIKIDFQVVLTPDMFEVRAFAKPSENAHSMMLDGISRTTELFLKYNSDFRWVILGVLEGLKPTPILITYYENLDLYIYTIELNQKEKEFMNIQMGLN